MEKQLDIFSTPRFDGSDYSPKFDNHRLQGQIKTIYALMIDGKWRTLGEIEQLTSYGQASISAQLRHLRKDRFGSHIVNKRNRGEREKGLYEYQLINPNAVGDNQPKEELVISEEAKLRAKNYMRLKDGYVEPTQEQTVQAMEMFDEIDGSKTFITKEDLEKIIQKEEHKQGFDIRELNRVDDIEIEEMSNDWETMSQQIKPKQEPCDNCNNDVCCCIIRTQETLEEALKNELEFVHNSCRNFDFDLGFKTGGLIGAKWQQQQDKNKYSDEEAGELVYNVMGEYAKRENIFFKGDLINNLFNKFKKK